MKRQVRQDRHFNSLSFLVCYILIPSNFFLILFRVFRSGCPTSVCPSDRLCVPIYTTALWSRKIKNLGVSAGPLACTFARTTDLFAQHCFARALCCPHSFTCSLTHFRACGNENDKMLGHQAVLNHIGLLESSWVLFCSSLRRIMWQIIALFPVL